MAARVAAGGGGDEGDEVSEALRAEIEEAIRKKSVQFTRRRDFGDAGAVFLAGKLCGNTTVESLWLTDCGIGAVGARALANVLAEDNTTLEQLSLFQKPSLGDDGAQAMAQMLRKNTTLEFLGLGFCGVGVRGLRALGEALKENFTLRCLVLNDNDFGDDGAHALAEALRWNESLGKLDLSCCQLTVVGFSYLLAALQESNSALTVLRLDCNFGIEDFKITDSMQELLDENKAAPATAERRARCLLFCCLQLAPKAHEHAVPSIGAVPVPVLQDAVEHAGSLHVAKRFGHGNAAAGLSSAGVRARSADFSADSESASSRRR